MSIKYNENSIQFNSMQSIAAPINSIDSDDADADESAFTIEPVSLGKGCKNSLECQIRDPFSACIGGICECIAKTPSCSAANRGNGALDCHSLH